MKLLIDSSVPTAIPARLRAAGHDVVAVADTPPDPGDGAILQWAIRDQRTIITLDKDFGTHSVVGGMKHFGVVRLVQFGLKDLAREILGVLATHERDLLLGALVTVEPGRIRTRAP